VGAGLRLGLEEGTYLDLAGQWLARSVIARVSTTYDPVIDPEVFEKTPLDAYVMVHARAGYAFRNGLDLSLAVSNLLDDRTLQFPTAEPAERPERRFTATLAYYH
jgi:outer membrane receptor protein involved in Fe transport